MLLQALIKSSTTCWLTKKHELADFFDVFQEESAMAYRGTFVVDPEGFVRTAEIHDMGIGRSAEELVRKVQAAQFVAKTWRSSVPCTLETR